MNEQIYELNSHIDFTLLDPRATCSDIERLCDIAYKNRYRAVCVNPVNVQHAKGYIAKNFSNEIKVVSVVSFPLGANSIEVKAEEMKQLIHDGVDEIEFVMNIGKIKSGELLFVKNEILKLKKLAKGKVLRCIVEVCYLDENDLIRICKLCSKHKISIVTSTGFGTHGIDDKTLSIILKETSGSVSIKATGGVRSREDAIKFLNLGASLIGTSRVL